MTVKTTLPAEGPTAEQVVRKPPFGAPHVFVLAVIRGEDTQAAYRITRAETIIGRGSDVPIGIDDTRISKRHCMIRVDGSICTLIDLGSRNGTRLNGRVLKSVANRLRHLDEIQIGETRMILLGGRFKQKPANDPAT
jgi:pSer/pThr/pTyr-binding forkhead associated (FHA) protein